MKKLVYNQRTLLLTSLLFFSFALSAQELKKEYHEEYKVEKGSTLDLSNKYGDIIVETSETDQVVIDVKVTLMFPNRERAERLLNYINVDFSRKDNTITVKTVIDDKFSFTGWNSSSRRFSIDYNVKMPVWMNLTLVNRYGNTDLDDINGLVDLNIKYGNLKALKFGRGNEKPINSLVLAYGKGSIEEAGWLDLNLRYSGSFTLTNNQALLLDSRYSKLQLGTVSSIVGETKYDNIRIEKINNLVLDAGYADINIGTLSKKLEFEAGYGSFNVEKVPSGFESIKIDSRYSGIRIGIDEMASYDLEAELSYAGLKYNETNFQNRRRIIDNNSTEISGVVGKDTKPSSRVVVKASYGSIRLY
ncbi:MAG TPA: hypothetical protein PK719_08230 [Bacteroidales bacterium]|jgi:hypothetical protein|nr:hypothetical protein [Bacteroidales bacterium]OQB65467.1 MAG: hypothetical protein BWX96_00046 [Bacteroidetes bacterium ADurb.Bin145]HOU02621.1 hypothetical protein [Bacteroidales bacterium]HQG63632.1 hypothetical protein [Bacteroidales bacterium]HQK67606.1 hypothetical protein [Bacteroidales bacterium]